MVHGDAISPGRNHTGRGERSGENSCKEHYNGRVRLSNAATPSICGARSTAPPDCRRGAPWAATDVTGLRSPRAVPGRRTDQRRPGER